MGSLRRGRDVVLLAILILVVAIPLLVAVVVLHHPRWYPMSDDSLTESHVREVGTRNPPLTGLGGRIGEPGPNTGSHPGPLSFWSLAIFYRLLGAGSWALHAGTAALNIIAIGLTLWMTRRRGGPAVMIYGAAILIVLLTAYGTFALTLPWNPYLPILWWLVTMAAVWSLLCGDLPMLPVAVFAASFCVQTHISYLGIGSAAVGVGAAATPYWIHSRRGTDEFQPSLRWLAIGVGLGALVWFPPIAEQVTGSQGHNLSVIFHHFSDPPEEALGLRSGADLLLAMMNPQMLLTDPVIEGRNFLSGPTEPGLALVGVWMAAVVVAGWLRHWTLLRLHALLAVVLAAGLLSASRIFGPPFLYLTLWGWGITAFILLAVGWTAAAGMVRLIASRVPDLSWRLAPVGGAIGALLLAGLFIRATVDAAHTDLATPELSRSAAHLVPQTVRVLSAGSLPGTGPDGRYLVSWHDPWYGGARGFSMINELDRAGFETGSVKYFRAAFGRHRVIEASEATAVIRVSVGPDIDRWEAVPGARRIVTYDPASDDERADYERSRAEVLEELERMGTPDAARVLDENPFAFLDLDGLSPAGKAKVARMIALGQPVAVFVAPPGAPA